MKSKRRRCPTTTPCSPTSGRCCKGRGLPPTGRSTRWLFAPISRSGGVLCCTSKGGPSRAEYGREIVRSLSSRLTEEFGRGYSPDNLWLIRLFCLTYQDRLPKVETPSQLSIVADGAPNSQTASGNLPSPGDGSISETVSRISALASGAGARQLL